MSNSTPLGASASMGLRVPKNQRVGAASAGVEDRPLGTIAKLPSIASQCGKTIISLGVVNSVEVGVNPADERRMLRFSLQSAARELLPRERVSKCLRAPIPMATSIDVYHSPKFATAHYGGLQICASVWCCPVCSAKVTERRRVELAGGVGFWRSEAGGFLLLVTYTLRHSLGDSLAAVLSPLLAGFDALHAGRWWVGFSAKHRIYGKVRSLEVTYGASGWHPHIHTLYFLGSGDLPAVNAFELALKERWSYLLKKQGRDASWEHGVDVRMSDEDIAEYIAKYAKDKEWTIEHEMTKSPSKIGKIGGRTAFQLLKDYSEGDSTSGRLFIQYAVSFKGKSQLHWSKGLRSLLQMDIQQSDEELAMLMENDALLLASLTREQWRVILGNDARAELLAVAASGDADVFWSFVVSLGVADPFQLRFLHSSKNQMGGN